MHRSAPLLALALLAAGCSGSSTPTAGTTSPEPSKTAPASAPSPPTAGTAPSSAAGTAARAIYYLGDPSNGPRLYREFHRRPATTGVVRDAVTAMLTEPAQDEDYTSIWPKGTRVRGVRLDGSTAVVDLSKEAAGMHTGSTYEGLSVQQLVWTATAADPSVKAVRLLIEGKPIDTLAGHVDTSRPMTRQPAAEILGPVWLLVPRSLKRGATFGGEASVFEATVSWEFRQGARVVKVGHTNADMGAPGRGPWSDTVNVPAGEYVLRAYETSAKDGTATFIDDKPVTVTS